MSSDYAVRCVGVAKSFQIFRNYNDRLWQILFGRIRKFYQDYWVLDDITLDVSRGECVGIIGRNGAGKTTLLQLICGITQPTRGEILTNGKIAPVLALGAGFDRDLTGRENALVGGAILGLRRKEVERRMDAIAEFAGIGDFFDRQVKLYSSGMVSRLAFSICASVNSDILVIDEVLAVGDEAFRDKCLRFLHEFRRQGTILFVSHNLAHVASLCDRVVWIDDGRIRAIGSAGTVIDQYRRALAQERDDGSRFHAGLRAPDSVGPRSRDKAASPERRLSSLAQQARAELENNILPFWLALEDPQYGGHYAKMECDGRLDRTGEKTGVFVGRVLWTLSEAHRVLGVPECLAQAGRTKRFLIDRMIDPEHGGVCWSVTHDGQTLSDRKRLYVQAFGIYGLSSYFRASGDTEARDMSMALFETVEARMRTERGGYYEECDAGWTPSNRLFTVNGHLHLLEAYSELLAATGAASVRTALSDLLVLIIERFVSPHYQLYETIDDQFRPLGSAISFGHDIEASWLLDEAADRLGDRQLSTLTRKTASGLARSAIRGGQQADGSWIDRDDGGGGLPEWRIWWVQAEGLAGTVNEILRSPEVDLDLLASAEATWHFIETRQSDRKGGDWFNEVGTDGAPNPLKPKVSPWKEPYHQARICLRLIERVSGQSCLVN